MTDICIMCGGESEELDRQCCPDCNAGIKRMAEVIAEGIDQKLLEKILADPSILDKEDEDA